MKLNPHHLVLKHKPLHLLEISLELRVLLLKVIKLPVHIFGLAPNVQALSQVLHFLLQFLHQSIISGVDLIGFHLYHHLFGPISEFESRDGFLRAVSHWGNSGYETGLGVSA